MRFLMIGIAALCWIGGSGSVWARTPLERQNLGETTGTDIYESLPRPHALPPSQWPEDLHNALRNFDMEAEQNGCVRQNTLAIHRGGVFSVLASTWNCTSERLFTLHRLKNGKLDLIKRLEETYVNLVEPSGMDVFPDHTPALFVDVGSGGSGYDGYQQHLFRVEANDIKEVTPPLRTIWMDGVDGRLLAMSSDDRWSSFFWSCGQCGPHFPVIQEWRDGAFRPACKSHPDLIKQRIALNQRSLPLVQKQYGELGVIEYHIEQALLLLQIGEARKGRAAYNAALDLTKHSRDPEIREQWGKAIQGGFSDVIAQAEKRTNSQCPVTDAKVPENYWEERRKAKEQ